MTCRAKPVLTCQAGGPHLPHLEGTIVTTGNSETAVCCFLGVCCLIQPGSCRTVELLAVAQLDPLLVLLGGGGGGELEGFRAVGEGAGEGGGLPAPLGVPLAGGGDLPGGGFILVPHQVLGVTARVPGQALYARRWYSRQLCLVACEGGLSPLDGDPGGEGEGGGVRAGHVWGWRPGGGWLLGAQVGQVTSSHTLSPPFSSHFT